MFKHAIVFFVLCGLAGISLAASSPKIARLMASTQPPAGVVFEIATAKPSALVEVIPVLKQDIEALRARFPGMPIVLVSHGREEFSLTHAQAARFGDLQQQIRHLTEQQQVQVEVCGRFAEMNNVEKSEFPSSVTVVPQGPAAIRGYLQRGFEHIVIGE